MCKISPIKQRILYFIDKQDIRKIDFCEKTGISYSNMKGRSLKSEIGGDKIGEILSIYPNLSPEWLLLGKGEMFRNNDIEIKQGDNEFLIKRFEELVRENQDLKKELEKLKNNTNTNINLYPEHEKE